MELAKVNKHCMTDGTYEYYRNERGEWKPGRYDGKTFWWVRTRKFAARHREYETANGPKWYRLTRYAYHKGKRDHGKPAYAPIGKHGRQYANARLETVHEVYYRHGRFFVACNVQREDGTYYNSLAPYSGVIYDAHVEQSRRAGIPIVSIFVNDGRPYSIEMDGERFDIAPGEWSSMYAEVLQIKDVEREDEKPEVDIIAAANAIVEAEAERLRWIESTTAAGEQISLLAYAGYAGDTDWQTLAYAGGR